MSSEGTNGLGVECHTHTAGKLESIETRTNTLLVLFFSWDFLSVMKYKIKPAISFNTA